MKLKRTLRERKFIKAYIENNGNATKTYLDISPKYKGNSARELGHRMLTKVDISVIELLEEMGATDAYLHQKLFEGLDATKVISVIPIPTKKGQENSTDLPDANSKNIEFVDVPDFNVRFKYLDMAYKLKDKYPSEKHKIEIEEVGKLANAKKKLIERIDNLIAKRGKGQTTKQPD